MTFFEGEIYFSFYERKFTYEMNLSDDLLTAAEVVAKFPIFSKPLLWRWARQGRTPSVILPPRRKLFRRSDIQMLLTPDGSEKAKANVGSEGWSDSLLFDLGNA